MGIGCCHIPISGKSLRKMIVPHEAEDAVQPTMQCNLEVEMKIKKKIKKFTTDNHIMNFFFNLIKPYHEL